MQVDDVVIFANFSEHVGRNAWLAERKFESHIFVLFIKQLHELFSSMQREFNKVVEFLEISEFEAFVLPTEYKVLGLNVLRLKSCN